MIAAAQTLQPSCLGQGPVDHPGSVQRSAHVCRQSRLNRGGAGDREDPWRSG